MLKSPAEGWKKVHNYAELSHLKAFLMTQMVKKLLALQETWVQSLGWEDPLEAGMATYSSILAWRIPWTEEPGGLQSMESQSDMTEWLSTVHSTSHLKHFFWMLNGASLVAQIVKRLPAVRETRVRFLGWEDPLEKEMATHSSTLAWKIPWTEEPGRLQSMDTTEWLHFHFHLMVPKRLIPLSPSQATIVLFVTIKEVDRSSQHHIYLSHMIMFCVPSHFYGCLSLRQHSPSYAASSRKTF